MKSVLQFVYKSQDQIFIQSITTQNFELSPIDHNQEVYVYIESLSSIGTQKKIDDLKVARFKIAKEMC